MGIIDYLCCFRCFGLNGKRKIVKTVNTSRKRQYLDLLEKIASKQKVMPITSDPTKQQMTELTDIHRIPTDVFPTEKSVISWYGFDILAPLSEGSFAQVYYAVHLESGLKIACKLIQLPDTLGDRTKAKTERKISRIQDIKNELFILQEMKHPNVIKMIRHFIIDANKSLNLYVFMEFATNGTLTQMVNNLGPFGEDECKYWLSQLISSLSYMHRKGIAHRDIKLSNILLDDSNDVLISDFGLSRIAYRKSKGGLIESNTYCGTPPFMAPELLEGKPYNPFLTDVWALGVVLFLLFCKDYPFNTKNKDVAIERMKACQWAFSVNTLSYPSKGLIDILHNFFQPDITLRPNIFQLRKHFWIETEFKRIEKRVQKLISKTRKTVKTSKSMKRTQKSH